jgi:iron complex outermembrane receptor protein
MMRLSMVCVLTFLLSAFAHAQENRVTVVVEVRSQSKPVSQAEVVVDGVVTTTNSSGEAVLQVPIGDTQLTIQRFGFKSQTRRVTIAADSNARLSVELEPEVVLEEEITVTATRTEQRIEDIPLRVEVLQQDEVEEKALMTPGDIAMLLNETAGLRVQVTSPSLGAANVRVQGLRGRYTQLLADGLPLYGGQTGAIGLLQIPPLDLGQVEVIKGVASALYGSSALGGVINLISRSPKSRERELLLNRTSRNGTDGVFWLAEPRKNGWGYTLLGGIHAQDRTDIDHDGWADLSGFRRATLRPRFTWDDGKGSSVFATIGAMLENRQGGTIGSAVVADGSPYVEELKTRRFDGGLVGRILVGPRVVSVRGSFMTQNHRHQFGPVTERDRHQTFFGEAAMTGTAGAHTWVIGTAVQTDLYRGHDVPRFNYTYVVPAVFAQDDIGISRYFTLSGSLRLDVHNRYAAFLNPRISALIRLPHQLKARISAGTGVYAPTPFTEETEAVGLSRLSALRDLTAERASSSSADIGWSNSHVELNATVFGSNIRHPIMLRQLPGGASTDLEIVNSHEPTRTIGSEFLARFRRGDLNLVLTHTYVHSTELDRDTGVRDLAPLTPRGTAGIVGMWEKEAKGRIGVEVFYTGRQRLDENPYRTESPSYWIVGLLVERPLGPVRLFVNAENLTNVRQTRYDPLVRPTRNFDGRWTVDAWAPLEGRVLNGGLRFAF